MSPQYPHPSKFGLPEPNDLARMRRLADLTQREAAEAIGMSPSTVDTYEAGDSSPRLEVVRALFDVYAEELPEPKADGGVPSFQDDPHGIFPTEFWKFYRSLEQAERLMNDTTPEEEKPRCTECGSTALRYKPGGTAGPCKHRKEGNWYCSTCGEHLTEVAQRGTDVADGEVGT